MSSDAALRRPKSSRPDGIYTGACPLDCPDTCNWMVTVKKGEAVALGGNRDHPYTRGALCVKVSKYLEYSLHPERVTTPLIRTGKKGQGQFRRATWDEVLALIASHFHGDIATHGPESIWPHQLTGHFGHLNGVYGAGHRLFNKIGASRNAITNCSVSGEMASAYTVGLSRGLDPMLMRHAKLIILWGTNTLSTNQHLRPFLEGARRNGAKIIAIDPAYSRTAAYADQHISIRPGTDAALALGLMNILVARGWQDQAFLDAHTFGWEEFRQEIARFPIERAANITGIPTETILGLATGIGSTRPTAIRMTQGMQRHNGGGMAVRTIMCLSAVAGDWAHLGGGASYDIGSYFQPNYSKLHADHLRPNPKARTLTVTQLGRNLTELSDPPVKSLFLWAGNPLASAPDTNTIERGLARDDLFTVVSDHFITETAKYADVFLPCTMQTEQTDFHNAYGHLYLAWNHKVCEAPGECLPMTEIFRRLARVMGYSDPELFASDEELAADALDSSHPSCAGITVERLKAESFVRMSYPEAPHSELGFTTPSGKFEFFSQAMVTEGLPGLASYTPPGEAVNAGLAGRFPFALITPASHYFLNSVFANFRPNKSRQGELTVAINPQDAVARGLEAGDAVKIYNDRGFYAARLEIKEQLLSGVAVSPKGHWSNIEGSYHNANATTQARDSDIGGGATYNDNRVNIVRLAGPGPQ